MIRDVLRESDAHLPIHTGTKHYRDHSGANAVVSHVMRGETKTQWDMPLPLATRHQRTELSGCRRNKSLRGDEMNHQSIQTTFKTGGATTRIFTVGGACSAIDDVSAIQNGYFAQVAQRCDWGHRRPGHGTKSHTVQPRTKKAPARASPNVGRLAPEPKECLRSRREDANQHPREGR